MSRYLGVLGDSLDGVKRLLTGGGILLVGELLLESLDGPETKSHVSANSVNLGHILWGCRSAKFLTGICAALMRSGQQDSAELPPKRVPDPALNGHTAHAIMQSRHRRPVSNNQSIAGQ
jgi:hypothetical protein